MNWDKKLALSLCILYTVFVGAPVALMVIYRNREPIKSRSPLLSIIPSLYGILFAWANTIFFLLTNDDTGDLSICPLFSFPYALIPSFYCVPISLKCIELAWRYRANVARLSKKLDSFFIRYEWFVSTKSMFILGLMFIGLQLLIAIPSHLLRSPPALGIRACHFNQIAHTNFVLILNFIVWAIILSFLVKVKDTFFIKYELLSLMAVNFPLLIFNLIYRSFAIFGFYPIWFGRICVEFLAMLFLGSIIQVIFPVCLYYYERYFKKSQIQHSGENKFNLEQYAGNRDLFLVVLDIPYLRDAFIKYCAESFCIENILFYMDTLTFKQIVNASDRFDQAMKIKKEYLDLNSPNLINLDNSQRLNLLEKINENNITETMFDEISETILYMIKRDPFRRWTASQAFVEVIDTFRKSTSDKFSGSFSGPGRIASNKESFSIPVHIMSSIKDSSSVELEMKEK